MDRRGWAARPSLGRDGMGLSTILLALLSREYHCFTPSREQVTRTVEVLAQRSARHSLVPHVGSSQDLLPTAPLENLDLMLIDGNHAYPAPQTDCYYGARQLRRGGVVIVDDLQLRAPAELAAFLEADPRWPLLARTSKWAAFRRDSEGPLAEEWWSPQGFFQPTMGRRALYMAQRAGRRLSRRMR